MLRALLLSIIVVLAAMPARAQDYPNRQITLITLTAPGAALDVLARIIGNGLQEQMGQPVVVVNRVGAGGRLGGAEIARAAPDGYTIGMLIVSTHGVNPTFSPSTAFDPIKDFTPITFAADLNIVLTINADFQAKTLKDFIAYSKANPGKLSFGSAGVGSALHMTGEMIKRQSGLDMTHVPYVGVAKSLPDLLAGQLQAIMGNPADVGNLIRDGRLRGLGVAAKTRDATLPDVPTFVEQGFPDVLATTWFGVGGPANLPRPIVDRLNKEVRVALTKPAAAKRLAELGMNTAPNSPEEFAAFIKSEIARWQPIAAAAKAQLKQ